jgi:formylglycine-generating enzyme required for sulfatase activity
VQWDVTEVTVGAFTTWVNAGRPTPTDSQPLDPGGPYAQIYWEQAWNTNVAAEDFKPATGTCIFANDFASQTGGIRNLPVGPTYGSATTTLPITCVNWFQAVAYCAWVGERLPTQAEWQYEAVARTREYTYPWGDSFGPNDCSHAIWAGDGGLSGSDGCGFPLPVGSAPLGVSFDGVQDLEGSVMEWVWDWFTLENPSAWPADYAGPPDDAGGDQRDVRGGSWVSPESSLQSILPAATDPTVIYTNLGFRCVKTVL